MRAKKAENERSAFVRRIIGVPPHWMVQWGIILIFSALIALCAIAYGLKYPDVVPSDIYITAENPPVPVNVPNHTIIKTFFVHENDTVTIGQPLALKMNTANFEDIKFLDSLLKKVDTFDADFVEKFKAIRYLQLGEVQLAYSNTANLIQALQKQVRIVHVQNQAKAELDEKLRDAEKQEDAVYKKYLNSQQKADVASRIYAEAQLKYINKSFALADYEKLQKDKEKAEYEVLYQKRILDDQIIMVKRLKKEALDNKIKKDGLPLTNIESMNLLESVTKLKNAIFDWKHEYLVTSPHTGKFIPQTSTANLKINPNALDVIGLIQTPLDTTLVGTMFVMSQYYSVIQPNQKVIIHLSQPYFSDDYIVEGIVEKKENTSGIKKNVTVHVKLLDSNNLRRKLIEKNMESTQNTILGRAEIIYAERTLLERIFTKFL